MRSKEEILKGTELEEVSYSKNFLENELERVLEHTKVVASFTREDIKAWSEKYKKHKKASLAERIAVICQAIKIWRKYFPRNSQITSVLALLLNKSRGTLAEIKTGEGKSIIIGMLATEKALNGEKPDIVTSSEVLAKRDAEEFSELYEFFGLKCHHNFGNNLKEKKEIYKNEIIYGTAHSFEADILQEVFYREETRGERGFPCVIIDEVDSMLLDGIHDCTYLSSPIPALEEATIFLKLIWSRLITLQYYDKDSNLDEQTIRKELRGYLDQCLKEYQIQHKLSDESKKMIQNNADVWCDNAITAYKMKENEQYVVEGDEVKIVDSQRTGVVLEKTVWQDGLHQFLEIKHKKFMSCESLISNWLSNITYFKKYNSLIGLTGTLGSDHCKKLLREVYCVGFVKIPTFKEKISVEYPPKLEKSENKWINSIIKSAENIVKEGRSVLIINETIAIAEEIHQRILSKGINSILYTRSDKDDQKNVIFSKELGPQKAIVATNLAGRGTDIKTSKELDSNGGLHVIITYFPNNSRVLEQAIGRTSREGKPGSFEKIYSVQKIAEKYGYELSHELLPIIQNFVEEEHFKMMRGEIIKYEKKDKLFQNFLDFHNEIVPIEKKDKMRWVSNEINTEWAFFVKKLEKDKIDENEYDNKLKLFKDNIKNKFLKKNQYNYYEINPLALNNVSNLNRMAMEETNRGNNEFAEQLAQRALDKEPNDPFANLSHAIALINQDKSQPALKALEKLQNSIPHYSEMRNTQQFLSFLSLTKEEIKDSKKVDLSSVLMKFLKDFSANCIDLIKNKKSDQKIRGKFLKRFTSLFESIQKKDINEKEKDGLQANLPLLPEVTIKKKSSRWGWLGAVFLGVGQIILGAVISVGCPFLAAGLGIPMMIEGVKDVVTGIKSLITGEAIDWSEYWSNKGINYGLILATLPLTFVGGAACVCAEGAGFFNVAAQTLKNPMFYATMAVKLGGKAVIDNCMEKKNEESSNELKQQFVKKVTEEIRKDIKNDPFFENKKTIQDNVERVCKELANLMPREFSKLIGLHPVLKQNVEILLEIKENVKDILANSLDTHIQEKARDLSNDFDNKEKTLSYLCDFKKAMDIFKHGFISALKKTFETLSEEVAKNNYQSILNPIASKLINIINNSINNAATLLNQEQDALNNEKDELNKIKQKINEQTNKIQSSIDISNDKKTLIKQVNDMIEDLNNKTKNFNEKQENLNSKFQILAKQSQKQKTFCETNGSKFNSLIKKILEILISKKIIDDSYRILVKKSKASRKIQKFLNNQDQISMDNEQASFIIQAILESCEESNNPSKELILKREEKINELAKFLANELESYAQEFVDLSAENMIRKVK